MAKIKQLAEAHSLFDPFPADNLSSIGADGHRGRMRARLLTAGPDALADHEMLEMVLFLALPRRDTKPIARALLARFGSFAGTIAAPVPALLAIDGLGEAGAAALKLVQGSALRLLRDDARSKPVFQNWEVLTDYLRATLSREDVEQARVLFLDTKNRLVADEVLARGTVDRAIVFPREIARRALELNAVQVILVHNHPSGDPTPSDDDRSMTRAVQRALAALGIGLHDHVIVAGSRCVSFRANRWL